MPTLKTRLSSSPERLLDILLMFENEETVSLKRLAERFGGSRSSTYRDVGFLRSRGFVVDAGPGVFRLGTAVERLANSIGAVNSLGSVARPHLESLADVTGESTLFCRRSGYRVHMLVGIDSRQMLRVSAQAADGQPLHCGSFGKVLLAFQLPKVFERVLALPLERVTDHTLIDPVVLRAELAAIRERGFAYSDSEVEVGTRSVAIPVWAKGDELLGSLTVAAPGVRMPEQRFAVLRKAMTDAANAISHDWADRMTSNQGDAATVTQASRSRAEAA